MAKIRANHSSTLFTPHVILWWQLRIKHRSCRKSCRVMSFHIMLRYVTLCYALHQIEFQSFRDLRHNWNLFAIIIIIDQHPDMSCSTDQATPCWNRSCISLLFGSVSCCTCLYYTQFPIPQLNSCSLWFYTFVLAQALRLNYNYFQAFLSTYGYRKPFASVFPHRIWQSTFPIRQLTNRSMIL